MSKEFGYIGKEVEQAFRSNKGIFTPQDIYELDLENKWTNFGQLELIETKTISSVSSAIFNSIKQDEYDVHFLTTTNFDPSDDDRGLYVRFFESGVEESASVYEFAYQFGITNGTFGTSKTTGLDFLHNTFNAGTGTNEVSNSYNYFYNLGDPSKYSYQTMHNINTNTSTKGIFAFGSGVLPQASIVNQIKLYVTSGTFSATSSLYGIRSY